MNRVVIIGRGASGKSALAVRLAEITRLPGIELDKAFWRPGLVATPGATPRDQWLVAEEGWIMDGDLGPYDALEIRLRAADKTLFWTSRWPACGWGAIRRSPERTDFWRSWRIVGKAVRFSCKQSPTTRARGTSHVFRNPRGSLHA